MGRRSIKEGKNIYQISREEAGLTRAAASEAIGWLSEGRLEKIESGASSAADDEVIAMADAYHDFLLCNRHCTQMCQIGTQNVGVIEEKELSQITLELLAAINSLERDKNRLIEIAADGQIHEDEKADFDKIGKTLESMASTIDSLKLWIATVENGGK